MPERDSVGIPEDSDKLERFKGWFKAARSQQHDWRKEAREMYDFYAGYGKQWSEEDSAAMKLQMRPIVEFNRTAAIVDSVCGLEVNNRQEVRYIPRVLGKSGVNELRTEAARWVRDECNAEDEESDSFFDCIVTGIGVTETRLDYDEDPDGKLLVLRTDPMEMLWDAQARRRNLVDARHIFRFKDIPLSDAIDMAEKEGFPSTEPEDLHAFWAMDAVSDSAEPHDAQWAPYYRTDQAPDLDKMRTKIRMVEVQWWEHERAWRVVNPLTRQIETLDDKTYSKIKKRFKDIVAARFNRKCYYRALLGNIILKEWDGPKDGGFTYKFITGKRDRNKGIWYGIVRAMRDPQQWANKWLAQIMYIINSNAKGGIIAEADVFENPQQAKEEWSDPSAVTIVNPGAIANKKLMPKEPVQYPTGIERLMQLAINSMNDVSGMSPEMLGQADREQSGVLEQHRKQSAMTILAPLFDSLRHYRKDQGKLMLWYIDNFLTDGRLIRIGGPEDAQYVPLVKDKDAAEYDVIVDDTPTSPNMKEQVWGMILGMAPILARMQLPPQIMLKFLKYSPFPASLVAEIEAAAQEMAQQQPQTDPRMVEAMAKAKTAEIQAQTEQTRAQAEVYSAQAKATSEKAKALTHIATAAGTGQAAQGDALLKQAQALNQVAQADLAASKANAAAQQPNMDAIEMILNHLLGQKQLAQDGALQTQQMQQDNQLAQQKQQSDNDFQNQKLQQDGDLQREAMSQNAGT